MKMITFEHDCNNHYLIPFNALVARDNTVHLYGIGVCVHGLAAHSIGLTNLNQVHPHQYLISIPCSLQQLE